MRITKISVKGLFGMFDHEIPLNQESRITIVHGPNGVGKTVLMRMVHGLFNFGYEDIDETRFKRFRVFFDNGATINVTRFNKVERLLIEYVDGTGSVDSTAFVPLSIIDGELHKAVKDHIPSHLYHIPWAGMDRWIDSETDEVLTKENLFSRYPGAPNRLYGTMPNWFVNIQQQSNIRLIQTLRLFSGSLDLSSLQEVHDEQYYQPVTGELLPPEPEGAPSIISDKIAEQFRRFLEDNTDKFIETIENDPKLIRSFWKIIQDEARDSISESPIPESIRQGLVSLGFEHYWDFRETVKNMYRDKFLLEERELFEGIINARFLFKSIEIDEMEGFRIRDSSGDEDEIETSDLSSGEMHLLTLYYQLLFEVQPDTLVMIDEPELSMNVVWQRNFLKDLQRIIELRKFDVLIATHSPQIIHDKWDWMVPLGERVDGLDDETG